MIRRPWPRAADAPTNTAYRPNFWARNVRYPTTANQKQIWLAISDAMNPPTSPTGGDRS